jgi:hypothetical protein
MDALGPPKAKGRVRSVKGLNKTETAYDAHLAMRQRLGEILWRKFEGITLKLADDTRFTPDFAVMTADGHIELHDTKALWKGKTRPHIEDDALVKLRTAAEMFPFTVKAVWAEANGDWAEKIF